MRRHPAGTSRLGAGEDAKVELRSDHPGGAPLARRLRGLAHAHLSALGRPKAGLSVLLTRDPVIRALNRRFRRVDRATDVLSFPLDEPDELGDVAISLDVARRRARGEGRPLLAEVDRYLVHGLLHLVGHDHEAPAEARAMAELEDRLLGEAGMLADSLRPGPAGPRVRARQAGGKAARRAR